MSFLFYTLWHRYNLLVLGQCLAYVGPKLRLYWSICAHFGLVSSPFVGTLLDLMLACLMFSSAAIFLMWGKGFEPNQIGLKFKTNFNHWFGPKMRLSVAQWKFTRPSASFQSSTHFAKQTCDFREPHPNRHKMGPIDTEHRFDLGLAQASIWQAYTNNQKQVFFLKQTFWLCCFSFEQLYILPYWHRKIYVGVEGNRFEAYIQAMLC